jgi:hypothetical protein
MRTENGSTPTSLYSKQSLSQVGLMKGTQPPLAAERILARTG